MVENTKIGGITMKQLITLLLSFGALIFALNANAAHPSRDSGRYTAFATIECASNSYKYATCSVPGRILYVDKIRNISKTNCVEGRNWGYQGNRVWVDNGCRGLFEVEYVRAGGGQNGQTIDIECSSHSYKYTSCDVRRPIRSAILLRQKSDTRCVLDRNWGYTRDRIWVDNGCRGTFRVRVGGRY